MSYSSLSKASFSSRILVSSLKRSFLCVMVVGVKPGRPRSAMIISTLSLGHAAHKGLAHRATVQREPLPYVRGDPDCLLAVDLVEVVTLGLVYHAQVRGLLGLIYKLQEKRMSSASQIDPFRSHITEHEEHGAEAKYPAGRFDAFQKTFRFQGGHEPLHRTLVIIESLCHFTESPLRFCRGKQFEETQRFAQRLDVGTGSYL